MKKHLRIKATIFFALIVLGSVYFQNCSQGTTSAWITGGVVTAASAASTCTLTSVNGVTSAKCPDGSTFEIAGADPSSQVVEDIRSFGASGSAYSTRGAIVAGSTQLNLSEAGDFTDGQYISILGAGTLSEGYIAPLNAKIISGGGTTILTLDTAASNSTPNAADLNKRFSFVNEYDFGLTKHNDAPNIQLAVDYAAQMFNFCYPPVGEYPGPIIYFPPGSYRVSSSVIVPPGIVLMGASGNVNTAEFTRIIMDKENINGDPYRTSIFQFTRWQNGVIRTNFATWRIQDLAFWWVTPGVGGTFASPLGGVGMTGNNGRPKYRAGSLLFGEDDLDVRIESCTFEHSPTGIYFDSAGTSDGGMHGMYIEDSEFDASLTGIYANNTKLALVVSNTEFYGGGYPLMDGVTGTVSFNGSQLIGGAVVSINNSHLSQFQFTGGQADMVNSSTPVFNIDQTDQIQINDVMGGGSGAESFIQIRNAIGGTISNNTITDSGYNASPPTGADTDPSWVGAIRLEGSSNIIVSGNSITTPNTAFYNGFGIITVASLGNSVSAGAQSNGNLITGNIVNGLYNGSNYRGQDRRINLSPLDVANNNVDRDGL